MSLLINARRANSFVIIAPTATTIPITIQQQQQQQLLHPVRPSSRRPLHQHLYQTASNDDDDNETKKTTTPIVIALTREEGNNDKLRDALTQQLAANHNHDNHNHDNVEIVELPCIAHADGPDYDQLAGTLSQTSWDYVVVTSPEAARVLASAWPTSATSRDEIPAVAAVGKATELALERANIPVAFRPSKATARVLARELPPASTAARQQQRTTTATTVLYPASAKAASTLQDGLTDRGCFAVTRLDTYDTATATWTPAQMAKAAETNIVCVASPSSIEGWLSNTQQQQPPKSGGGGDGGDDSTTRNQFTIDPQLFAACIGETSAEACRKFGFAEEQIFYPDKPGIPGWVDAIQRALERMTLSSSHSSSSSSSSSSNANSNPPVMSS